MHPDFSLVLQKCASNLSLKHKQPILFSAYINGKNMSGLTAEVSNNSPDDNDDLVRIVSDEEDDLEAEDTLHLPQLLRQHEDVQDNISLCSELSVGKENAGEERPALGEDADEEVLDISDTHSNSSNDEMQHSPSVISSEAHINPFALANTLRFPVPFGLPTNNTATQTNISPFQEEFLRKSHLYAEELMKHQMQLMAAARASAFSLRSNSLTQIQQTSQFTCSPSVVHHLNPLAKIGQLSAAAAAALTAAAQQNHKPLNHSQHAHHMLQQQQQQHSHLQHSQYPFNNDTLAKLTDLSKQHSPSTPNTNHHHMMSTLNQLQTQMQAHLPGLLNDNNDNLHERALKFSIDNILKADFGRSNSLDSPPQQRKGSQQKSHSHRQKLTSISSATAPTTILNDSLEHANQSLNHNISPSTQTFSSSLATICTNSNDSSSTAVSSSYSSVNGAADLIKSSPSQTPTLSPIFAATQENGSGSNKSSGKTEETATSTSATGTGSGPIVWPAWVYCTRYSDRPSSGRSKYLPYDENKNTKFTLRNIYSAKGRPRVRKPKAPKTTNSSSATAAAAAASAAAAAAAGSEKANSPSSSSSANTNEDKRPRTAFSGSQLARLKHEFNENRYLTEKRRQQLSSELGLNEAQIKIWFQNKRAKLKKSSGVKNPLALQLMAQGLYNHSTIPLTREEEELQELQEREKNNNNSNSNNNSLQQQQATGAVSS